MPLVGINLFKNRICAPQIFSTEKRRVELVQSVNSLIRSSENIQSDFYPADDCDKVAEIICDRLSPEDKISEVNALCERLENTRKFDVPDLKTALDTLDISGVKLKQHNKALTNSDKNAIITTDL